VDFARAIATKHRCAVDVSVHRPGQGGDTRNHHAHLLCTTRRLQPNGFQEKTRELDDMKNGEVIYWRERWATLTNERLKERGSPERGDHRTLEAQGIDRVPTVHKGRLLTAIERRGIETRVARRLEQERAEDVQARITHAAEIGRLERERTDVEKSILVLSTDIAAARRERDRDAAQGRNVRAGTRRWSSGTCQPSSGVMRFAANGRTLRRRPRSASAAVTDPRTRIGTDRTTSDNRVAGASMAPDRY
jgi:hypothetical protein